MTDAAAARNEPDWFTQWSLRLLGPAARKRMNRHSQLPPKLAKAGIPLVPYAYLAQVYAQVAIVLLVGALAFLFYLILAGGPAAADPGLALPLFVAPIVLSGIVYSYGMLRPDLEIGNRRRSIDDNLPYGLNFMAALAAAGVVPDEVFGALGKQKVYGQMATQASLIHRDTALFSMDLVGALREAAKRSPSAQFEEFLQGAVNTVTGGGDLKTYMLAKAEHFSQENRRKQRGFLESLGVMAESYVVVAAAAPLFLIVILSVMLLLNGNTNSILMLNLLVLVGLPIIHGMFVWLLRNMRAD